ncbi:MAG: diacylglycerol kinase family lipid kinase [Acidobacteria bacterium]|jgi:YegS/Rv2252/BmrU family lipid kinase|nr:MAG: diacylglycerol kinase family lipid kinase [Acidobacteriota bacterium]GIU81538.1 MAG: diacylglycerol kinase [Pyrinomonadaceae bacterium]
MAFDPSVALVIVNPQSASGSTRERWAEIASDLRAHFGAFQVAFTKKQGDGIEIAFHAAKKGRKFIIACGGDGTINEVANGILLSQKDVELGILPSGTGGDFRRTLGISTEVRQAAKQLREGVTRLVDVGKVSYTNDKGEFSERYFLNVASFGLSASVIRRVKTNIKLQWLPLQELRGKLSFALSTLQEIMESNSIYVKVKIDEKRENSLITLNFCICNARFFGGGMKIAPNARINDGLFDVVNIGDISALKVILNSYSLYQGTHLSLPEVGSTLAKTIEAKPFHKGQEIQIEVDGELIGKLPAKFEIIPNALKIRVPS